MGRLSGKAATIFHLSPFSVGIDCSQKNKQILSLRQDGNNGSTHSESLEHNKVCYSDLLYAHGHRLYSNCLTRKYSH